MKKQFWLIAFILVIAILYLRVYTTIEAVPLTDDIDNFPKQVGSFTMTGSSEFSEGVLQELGVSSYINRDYRDKDGYKLSLYWGYYEVQKEGSLIHSPKHCMPGSGWNPVNSEIITIQDPNSNNTYKINKILFQKGMDKISMLYWYQGRNRIVANEYLDRYFLIQDAILRQRSEGSLIRIIGPWIETGESEKKQHEFAIDLFKLLEKQLPN